MAWKALNWCNNFSASSAGGASRSNCFSALREAKEASKASVAVTVISWAKCSIVFKCPVLYDILHPYLLIIHLRCYLMWFDRYILLLNVHIKRHLNRQPRIIHTTLRHWTCHQIVRRPNEERLIGRHGPKKCVGWWCLVVLLFETHGTLTPILFTLHHVVSCSLFASSSGLSMTIQHNHSILGIAENAGIQLTNPKQTRAQLHKNSDVTLVVFRFFMPKLSSKVGVSEAGKGQLTLPTGPRAPNPKLDVGSKFC